MSEPIKTKPWDRVEETPRGTIIVTSKITGRSTVYPADTPKVDVYHHDSDAKSGSGETEYKSGDSGSSEGSSEGGEQNSEGGE